MSITHKKRLNPLLFVPIIFAGLSILGLLIYVLVHDKNIALLQPKGRIAQEQYNLMVKVVGVLLLIAIPALTALYFVAYKYRENNPENVKRDTPKQGKKMIAVMWSIPIIIALTVVSFLIPATHTLAPQKSITSDQNPLKIQVVAMRWKWLFLYPEEGIASVNFVQIPKDRPVVFELTSDEAPMSSFWIPNLGGQLYTMTSHVNNLNLVADTIGDYPGSTPEINGAGFSRMTFTVRVSEDQQFAAWVATTKSYNENLDQVAYSELLKPSEDVPVAYYSRYVNGLYDSIVEKYNGHHHGDDTSGGDSAY